MAIFFVEGQNNIKSLGTNFKDKFQSVDIAIPLPKSYSPIVLADYSYNKDIFKLNPTQLTLPDVVQIITANSGLLKNNLANIFAIQWDGAFATVGAIWHDKGWYMVLLQDDKIGWSTGGLLFN